MKSLPDETCVPKLENAGSNVRFHQVDSLIPDDQEVRHVPPDMCAREALQIMQDNGYSQLPVVVGKRVLGLFSYRSFAEKSHGFCKLGKDPYAAEVIDLVEDPEYVTRDDDLEELVGQLQRDDAVLVGGKFMLQGVLTAADVMEYLYQVSNAFFLLEEIELVLRHLMSIATTTDELRECISAALTVNEREPSRQRPSQLKELTLGQYVQVLEHGSNWPRFMSVLGKNREIALSYLRPIPGLRNDVFHFKRQLSIAEHETLAVCRKWLHRRYSFAQARNPRGQE